MSLQSQEIRRRRLGPEGRGFGEDGGVDNGHVGKGGGVDTRGVPWTMVVADKKMC